MNREGLIKIYDSKFLQKEGETDLVFETDDKINLKDDIKFSFLNKAKVIKIYNSKKLNLINL